MVSDLARMGAGNVPVAWIYMSEHVRFSPLPTRQQHTDVSLYNNMISSSS